MIMKIASIASSKVNLLYFLNGVIILLAFSTTQGAEFQQNEIDQNILLKEDRKDLSRSRKILTDLNATLIPLGQVGDKTFFAANTNATFIESLEVCHRNGLIAADIESTPELAFLARILNEPRWTQHYFWTSGNDLEIEGDYRWFGSRKNVKTDMFRDFHETDIEWNCVQLSYRSYLFDYDCSDEMAMPLCQEIKTV